MNKRNTVYAVDFDGTLCTSAYPRIGEPNLALIDYLLKKQAMGDKIILWTCRCGERLKEAVEWCLALGLEFDAVNENLPEIVAHWGSDCRKIAADVYIDDKAICGIEGIK